MTNLYSLLVYSAGEFQALKLIVLAVFESVNKLLAPRRSTF